MNCSTLFRRRVTRWITMVAITLTASLAMATTPPMPDPFVSANAMAARGDHVAAVKAFEHVIATEGWSANALLGLANAYASSGDHGRAVLALERARLIAPRDAAISENLTRVRETAGLDISTTNDLDRVVATFTADAWFWISFGGLALACTGVLAIAWATRRRRLGAVAVLCGATVAVGAAFATRAAAPRPNAVIVVEADQARIAPFPEADAAFPLRAGEQGHVEQRRGGFVYVRLGAERAGWIRDSAVEHVIPSDRRSDAG